MGRLSLHGGDFLRDLRPEILSSLLSVFFLSLLVLLTFSNGIISFGSLFRSDETAFLFTGPVRSADLFAYKVSESLLFSSWAFLFLAFPLTVALGVAEHAPWYYYPGAVMIFGVFALCPRRWGIGALIVGRYLSRSRRRVVVVVIVAALFPAALWVMGLARAYRLGVQRSGEAWLQNVLGRLGLARNVFLPSYWPATAS